MGEICATEGCPNLRTSRGSKGKPGQTQYRKWCDGCYRRRRGKSNRSEWLKSISALPCARCGWNESLCDKHRFVPGSEGGTYREDNVVPLCPNCHRLVTVGLVESPSPQSNQMALNLVKCG